jgi:hypothetical protein
MALALMMLLAAIGQDTEAKKTEAALLEREGKAATTAERIKIAEDWAKAAQKFPKEKKAFEDKSVASYEKAWGEMDDAGKVKFRTTALKLARVPEDFSAFRKGQPSPSGWDGFSEVAGACIEDKAAFSGTRCGKMVHPGKDNKAGNSYITTLKFKVQPGKEYAFSARIFSDRSDAPGLIQLRFYDAANKDLSQVGPTVDGDLPFWKRLEGSGKAPEGAAWADVSFSSRLTSGFFLIDDVSALSDAKELLTNGGFEKR